MGVNASALKQDYNDALKLLSTEEQETIIESFRTFAGDKGKKVDRSGFAKLLDNFGIPANSSDTLFEAFDRKKTGFLDLEEFVCGLAVLRHGSFRDKCTMLFRIFNLDGEEGVSEQELKTVLLSVIRSTDNFMDIAQNKSDTIITVQKIVDKAFQECDISHTGTLLPYEFEYWVKKNPTLIEPLFGWFLFEDGGHPTEEEQVDTNSPPNILLNLSSEDWESEKDAVSSIWPLPPKLKDFCGDPAKRNVSHDGLLSHPVVKYHHLQSNIVQDKGIFNDVDKVFKEIQNLVQSGSYQSAFLLTGEILMAIGESVSPFSLQLWTCRFSLMSYLGMYDSIAAEFEGFGNLDKVDLFYEFWPDKFKLRTGSFVPFSMRVLHAQIPLMQVEPNPLKALDRVYVLKLSTEKVYSSLKDNPNILNASSLGEAEKLWNSRILQVSLLAVQCFITLKDYDLAAAELKRCCELFGKKQAELQLLLSRMHYMLGDLELASQIILSESCKDSQGQLHQVFIPLFEGRTDEALFRAREALKHRPKDPLIVNNYAVCLFHARQPQEAVKVLEEYVLEHSPHKAMMDNLFLAYELESLDSNSRKEQLISRAGKP